MNTAIRPLLSLLALAALCPQFAAAQGSLTPPAGPPVASMKTLDQVEARTPLVVGAPGVAISAAGTITISQPGSYYLTRNVSITTNVNGIEINADATVDLNGFSISGAAAAITSGDAIVIGTTVNATIRNGIIKGGTTMPTDNTYTYSGFRHGVFADFPPAGSRSSVAVSDLKVSGVRQSGIFLRRVVCVERCTVQGAGGNGIDVHPWFRPDSPSFDSRYQSHVKDSHAGDCGGQYGIAASRVSGCFGHTNRNGSDYTAAPCGIVASLVENSTGWGTGVFTLPIDQYVFGIHGTTVSYSSGRGASFGIRASIAIACTYIGAGGIDSPSKHLGTP